MPSVLVKYLSMSEERDVEMDLDVTLDRGQEEDSATVMEIITELAERLIPKKGGRMLEDFGFAMEELSRPKIYLCTIPYDTWSLVPGSFQHYYRNTLLKVARYADIYTDAGSPLKRLYIATYSRREMTDTKCFSIEGLSVQPSHPSFHILATCTWDKSCNREFTIVNGIEGSEKAREFMDFVIASASNTAKNRQRVVYVPRQV
jgi:hypothetical protein